MVQRLLLLVAMALLLLAGRAEAAPTQIRLFGYDEAQGLVVLYGNGPMTPRSFHLSSPERWVVDIPNARYNDATTNLKGIPGTPIRRIRAAQFKGGVLRIVFDLERKAEFAPELTNPGPGNYRLAFKVADGNPSAVAAPGTPAPVAVRATPAPTAVRSTPRPRPTARPAPRATRAPVAFARPHADEPAGPAGLSLHRVGGGWQLTLTTQSAFTYAVARGNRGDRLQFDLQGAGSELPKDSLYVDNGLIARVRIVPLNPRTHRVIVEFDQPIPYQLRQMANQKTLVLSLGGAPEPTPQQPQQAQTAEAPRKSPDERRVTIDAGHGGHDPGTIGYQGTLEKDVTLQMALRLRKLMQDSGMQVEMTRTKDMQIHLRPRVEVGDAFDSDVFISIHANHVGDPRVTGIETYYFTPKSLPLARSVHRKLVNQLKRPDRGIRRNNFVVVKYNKMPAVLVEVGYLSNPTEERLLNNAQYQQRAAEAIMAGVQEYFRTRSLRQ